VAGPAPDRSAAEKKPLHAIERDREENRKRRKGFLQRLQTIPPENLIILDESRVTTQMTRGYARAIGRRRVHEAAPGGPWNNLAILGP